MPIVMSKDEWNRITKWTDTGKEDPEVVRRREYVQYLKDRSTQMTKDWPNSLENVNKRNEELRRKRIEAAEQANTKFYKRYVKRQKEQQQRLMHSARDTIFKNKDAPKLLLSAVIETVVQKEREEQLKFRSKLRQDAAKQKYKEDEDIIRSANEWHELQALKRKRRFEANKKHQQEILEQAHEIAERNRIEYETELNMQKVDNVKANEQIQAIKEFEENFKAEEKARIWSDMERARLEAAELRRQQQARESLDLRLQQVLQRSRARVEDKRRRAEAEAKQEKLRVLEKISQKLESGDAAREAKEQANLEKALVEREAAEEARREAQLRKQQQFREQRMASREQFLREEEQRHHELSTMRQWDIMNRFKNVELYEDFKEELRKEKERKIQEYRDNLLKQWREREEREARERAETRHFYGALALSKLRDADNKLLTHAEALRREARAHGRPPHALDRAIDRYCKMYRLYPMPELPKPLKAHFPQYKPWDGSQPDPWYKEPPPPPPDEGPDAPDARPDAPGAEDTNPTPAVQRDGLQDTQASPTKRLNVKEESQPDYDYKRKGRANGLQRRDALTELVLPSVVPCETVQCNCDLKSK